MKQREFAERTARLLRVKGSRKHVPQDKKVFTFIDPNGREQKFTVKEPAKDIEYSAADVMRILDGMVEVAKASVRTGEKIHVRGFGSLFAHFRADQLNHDPNTGELRVIKARFIPKFVPGRDLKQAAMDYSNYLKEMELDQQAVYRTDEMDEFYDEFDDDDFDETEIIEEDLDTDDGNWVELGGE